MSETQVLMAILDFPDFFFLKSFPGRGLNFSIGGFLWGGIIFK